MISISTDELRKVVSSVASWPADARITLARKILETVEHPLPPESRGLRAEEVIELLKLPQPAPSDAQCDRIIEEGRLAKYAR